jgi:hypothetical protein
MGYASLGNIIGKIKGKKTGALAPPTPSGII